MKSWAVASAWIFGILCGINGGVPGFFGGMIVGYVIGLLFSAAAVLMGVAIRLAIWAGLLAIAVLALSR